MDINELFKRTPSEAITALKDKAVAVPRWSDLIKQYDPTLHPVMDITQYPDATTPAGIEKVTRIALGFQKLAVKRMTELCTAIPVKRIYKPENDRQKEITRYIEKIFTKNRIDHLNTERLNMLFAACEVMTLWYAVEQPNALYGFKSAVKLRCRNFSPMQGHLLYPLFDEYGDLIALSVSYSKKEGKRTVNYFDTYTATRHVKYSDAGEGDFAVIEDEAITLGKIPAVYCSRPEPIWGGEETSNTVYEMEWSLSRNGNYLRRNSKPLFVVTANEEIAFGHDQSQDREYRAVLQYPAGSKAEYVTWSQAVDNLKFHINELRSLFFTQLQLPDWSYEKMSQQALSGESRKQLFIDSQLKVKDESGRLLEFFDREINVVRSFLKVMLGNAYADDIDALEIETEITPFSISDDKETINNLVTANGGKPLLSQRESIEYLGWSNDPDQTLKEIESENVQDVTAPAL